jgi:putative transposase
MLGSQAIQDIVERIDRAYKQFFKSNKHGVRQVSPPNFKKSRKYKSFTLKQAGYSFQGPGMLRIGDTIYKYWHSRDIEGAIKTVTIKRDALGDMYVYIACEMPETSQNRIMTGKSAGCDFGLKTFLTLSDGTVELSPLFYHKELTKLRKASRALSSKAGGSNNRKKAGLSVARSHKKVAHQRKDYHFKLAHRLTTTFDYLFFEDLNLEGMKKLWGKKISDLALSEFLKIIEYYSRINGSTINFIDRFYPSSKTCHQCLYIKEDLCLADRTWQCLNCRTTHDRDLNAAINIKNVGASTFGLGVVRPTKLAISV